MRFRKISDFDRNYHFTIFQRIRIFSGFTRGKLVEEVGKSEEKMGFRQLFKDSYNRRRTLIREINDHLIHKIINQSAQ